MAAGPSNYAEYLLEIQRAPEDDVPRLALARFVHPSEPDLETFIWRQIERARRDRVPEPFGLHEASATERAILAGNIAAWTSRLAPYVVRVEGGGPACTFHRGLIAHVVVEPEMFLEHAERLLTQAPIRHVDFATLRPGVLPELLACDALARLDSVGFAGVGLDDDAVGAIAACPRLARCLYLDLSRNALGPPAFSALAASPHLRQLLVVERAQEDGLGAALTWHPGEVVVTKMTGRRFTGTRMPIRTEGHALEAVHGYVPWLHLDNRVQRFDVRWFVEQGLRPVLPAGTAATPLVWEYTGDGEAPLRAHIGDKTLTIRVNHVPAEPRFTLLVDGTELEDFEDWPTQWTTPPTPPQRSIDLDTPPVRGTNAVRVGLLRQWSEQLCRASGTPDELVRALGIAGEVLDQGRDYDIVEPPPPGAMRLVLMKSKTRDVYQVEVSVEARQRVRRLDMDAEFGTGDPVPQVHPDDPFTLEYIVEVPGAPCMCAVLAKFSSDEELAPASVMTEVILQRNPPL